MQRTDDAGWGSSHFDEPILMKFLISFVSEEQNFSFLLILLFLARAKTFLAQAINKKSQCREMVELADKFVCIEQSAVN